MSRSTQLLASFTCLLPLALLPACESFSVSAHERSQRLPDYGRELPEGEVALEKVTDPALYPDFGRGFGERDSLIRAIDGTLAYFAKPSSKNWFPYLDIDHDRARRSLEVFKQELLAAVSPADLNQRIVDSFEVYRSKGWDGSGTVLFTGYCTPIYQASLTQTAEFRYPLYRLPPELIKDEDGTPRGWITAGAPAPTRAEFDAGALAGRGLELVWLKDRLEAYIVHVQGSARLEFADGSQMTVGYAGKTGHEYVGLGQSLVKDGKIDKGGLSLFAVKNWFAAHPEELDEYLARNQSYVFFTESVGGPFGSINVEVTPYRTLATDKKVFPRGGVTFTETNIANMSGSQQPFHQFMLDQDTGGAIRSAGRADIYLGVGPEAERMAGFTYSEGRLWYVYVKPGL